MEIKTQEIQIVDAPQIPGLTFRAFRDEEDYPEMFEIFKATMDADGIEVGYTLEEMIIDYQHLERCDPYTDMLFAEINGEPIAFGRCWWDSEPNGIHRYRFFVNILPEYRETGIWEVMADTLIQRLKEISADHPKYVTKYLQGWARDKQKWQQGMLEALGLKVIRYGFEMVRPCSQPMDVHPLPEGLEVRPATPDQYRQIWEAAMEAFRDHWGFVEPTEKNYQNWLEFPYTQPELWKVAWDGDQVVGMVLNFINHDENQKYNRLRGYTEDISVRRPWRRQGVARALLTQSIQMFIDMGMDETDLAVDAENPNGALKLYKSVGYEPFRTSMIYRKPLFETKPNGRHEK